MNVQKIVVSCPNCGIEKEHYPSDVKRGKRYCSYSCAHEHGMFTGRPAKAELKITACKECEEPFTHLRHKKRIYCSNTCANINNAPRYKGSDAPNWKGGITPIIKRIRGCRDYKIWRTAVFERDNFACQHCGETKSFLHAHHIIHLSKDISRALDMDNGITLCIPCHQKEHPELKLTLGKGDDNGNY